MIKREFDSANTAKISCPLQEIYPLSVPTIYVGTKLDQVLEDLGKILVLFRAFLTTSKLVLNAVIFCTPFYRTATSQDME